MEGVPWVLVWLTLVLRIMEFVVVGASRNRGLLSMYLCAKGAVSTSSKFVCDRVIAAMAAKVDHAFVKQL